MSDFVVINIFLISVSCLFTLIFPLLCKSFLLGTFIYFCFISLCFGFYKKKAWPFQCNENNSLEFSSSSFSYCILRLLSIFFFCLFLQLWRDQLCFILFHRNIQFNPIQLIKNAILSPMHVFRVLSKISCL